MKREELKQQNFEHYVPLIEGLGATQKDDYHWELGRWYLQIGAKCRATFKHNNRWAMNIEKFLDNPEYWIEEAEKKYEDCCEYRRTKKQEQKNDR